MSNANGLIVMRAALGCAALGCAALGPWSQGRAETIEVSPDPCPAPVDAPIIVGGGDVLAVDLNPGRRAADNVTVFYDEAVEGWARRRLFARFAVTLEDETPRVSPSLDQSSLDQSSLDQSALDQPGPCPAK